jgi:general nucleoside transport system permease protein
MTVPNAQFFRFRPQHSILASPAGRAGIAVALALLCAGLLVMLAGADPLAAGRAVYLGAFGSVDRIVFGLNRATPYILCGTGVALCFRARIINIGGEGQIALGGLCAAWAAFAFPSAGPLAALGGGVLGGMAWAILAAVIHVGRGVNEVVVTLLMNFIAALIVEEALHGPLGETGAGFLQSPLLPDAYALPKLLAKTDLHAGILIAIAVALAGQILLRRTSWGFALRVFGESRRAAAYAGFSAAGLTIGIMALAGALAGLAGAIEVLGIHRRLIDGFSHGFGFNAIAVALLATLEPWAVIPAGLFFGFLEAGTAAMQRQVGVPSSLVIVTQGLTMLYVLAAMARAGRKTAG